MRKQLVFAFLVAILALAAAACGSDEQSADDDRRGRGNGDDCRRSVREGPADAQDAGPAYDRN